MKWTFSIKNKLLTSGILFVLCLLVLLSNYLDRIHAQNVKSAITTLYEDRLIADDYILKMTGRIYQIREVLHQDSNALSNTDTIRSLIADLRKTLEAFEKTKFTPTEETVANEFNDFINRMESHLMNNQDDYKLYSNKALISLQQLAAVQLDESKLIMKRAESEYASIKASSRFAFAITIIIFLVLQAIAFSGQPLISKTSTKDPMLN